MLDNVSKDSTRQQVEAYAKQDSRVILVWAPETRSVVDAYFRGYREALANGCEWILEMDAGMSHDPSEIPRFLEAMSRDVDFVAGSRSGWQPLWLAISLRDFQGWHAAGALVGQFKNEGYDQWLSVFQTKCP